MNNTYSINPLPRPVLITPDECTARQPNVSLDSRKWLSAIEIAEVRLVIPVIGYNLYNDICNQKNILVTSGNIVTLQGFINSVFGIDQSNNPKVVLKLGMYVNSINFLTVNPAYVSLWNMALWNFVYNCVFFVALTENYSQFSNAGILKNNPVGSIVGDSKPSNSVGISLGDLRYLNDRWLLDRITPLQDFLEQYLCANVSTINLYPSSKCNKWNKDTQEKRTTEFINIYDDCDDDYRYNRGRSCGCNSGGGGYIPPTPPTPPPFKMTCTINIQIVASPDVSQLYQLCNLQTIPLQYLPGNTLTLANLIGKYVNSAGMTKNGNPVNIPFDTNTGTFDNTLGGGFSDGDTFEFLYSEIM